MKQVDVTIMGHSYLLGCPEDGQAQLLAAVQKVDAAMCVIRDAGKVRARERIAVLAALNLAFELVTSANPPALPSHQDSASETADGPSTAHVQHKIESLIRLLDQSCGPDGQLL